MPKRIVLGKPVSVGFWDPWSVEETIKKPKPREEPREENFCVICLSKIEEGAPTIQCPHCGAIGHRSCFEEWIRLKGACPLCKRPITL